MLVEGITVLEVTAMSEATELGPGFELRDPSGRTLGVFVPDSMIQELRAECERLRRQVAQLQAERDDYLQALRQVTGGIFPLTREELDELDRTSVPFEQVIEQVERELKDADHA
jgi:hypothetical protein